MAGPRRHRDCGGRDFERQSVGQGARDEWGRPGLSDPDPDRPLPSPETAGAGRALDLDHISRPENPQLREPATRRRLHVPSIGERVGAALGRGVGSELETLTSQSIMLEHRRDGQQRHAGQELERAFQGGGRETVGVG